MTFKIESLSDLVKRNIPFRNISTGWLVGRCQCCNDYKERAGFKFDGLGFVYNCWNCGISVVYDGNSSLTGKGRKVLHAYGINDSDIDASLNSNFFKKEESSNITLSSLKAVVYHPIDLPEGSFKLGEDTELDYQLKLAEYLENRKVNFEDYPFYANLSDKFKNRVIIPFYKNGQLIYWQARSIVGTEKLRYLNAPVQRDGIIFNIDKLYTHSKIPLFVTEGVFDALMVNGVALLSSQLSEHKVDLLKQSKRRIIFLIDKDLNGKKLGYKALEHGWEILLTPEGTTDLNDCVKKYGKIWTAHYLMNGLPLNNNDASLQLELNCKGK